MNEEPLIIWLEETMVYTQFLLVNRMDNEKFYGIKFYFNSGKIYVDLDFWVLRSRFTAYPITTKRVKNYVRKGLVKLFHDAKR